MVICIKFTDPIFLRPCFRRKVLAIGSAVKEGKSG